MTLIQTLLTSLLITALPFTLAYAETTNKADLYQKSSTTPDITPETILIAEGRAIIGSDQKEREYGYQLDEVAYGHSVTRHSGWYDSEFNRQKIYFDTYSITKNLITNAQYAEFLKDTDHPQPQVDKSEWDNYGLIHPFTRAQPYIWQSNSAPKARAQHPVVMVSFSDAIAYAKWLSQKTEKNWQLPSEHQWEKAVRGTDGRYFPWGNHYDAKKLNSHDQGPFATVPIGQFIKGASPFGLLDGAGQVFEWTSTPAPAQKNRHIVKGGSWDDKGCGVCRAAARHSRPDSIKHILIGFRLVRVE